MIQRVQTLYLLLALICAILLFLFPVWQSGAGYSAQGMDMIGASSHFFLLPVAAILVISNLITIFVFKNRKRQKQLCTGNILLFTIFILWALVIIQLEHQVFQHFNILEFRLGAILPIIGIFFNILARQGIKKDEALIRSMDRLR